MPELYEQLGLTRWEYDKTCEIQGREPTHVELAIFSLMWSEHCGYKHSKPLLKRFPVEGEYVLQGPGENAGVVDIGNDMGIAMKVESHNHPSAVEPYQGAATGVGGIVRDIFAMGARPICSLDSLRFGEIEPLPGSTEGEGPATEASLNRQRYLFEHVVAGVGGYGNCMGIPTVGGEIYFEDPYAGNCLVNAMTVGIVKHQDIIRSKAAGVGNYVVLFGSKTGRDGIGGASVLASQVFDETLEEKRPSVQVGDPFTEKKLLEACLELLKRDLLVALQDLGAAGITSSSSEMAAKGEVGIDIHADRVPLREADMMAWEIMASESQERMLAIVTPDKWPGLQEVCDRWDLDATIVGEVTDTKNLRVFWHGEMVGDMAAEALTEPPTYDIPQERPAHEVDEPVDPADYPAPDAALEDIFRDILSSPNIASRRWIWEQYDHQVQLNTVIKPGSDAAVLQIKKSGQGIALCTDGNGRRSYLDPYRGGKAAVAEAARNVVCSGAKPIAITNCLNFGNPDNGPIAYQLARSIEGMAEACEAFNIPVISGNVSLYNESFEQPIYPTAVVGMLGLMEDVTGLATMSFKEEGDVLFLLGDCEPLLDGSEYQKRWFGGPEGRPAGRIPDVNLGVEKDMQDVLLEANSQQMFRSAHDVSDGGLAVALAECCMAGKIGASVDLDLISWDGTGTGASTGRADLALFGEAPTLVLVSTPTAGIGAFRALCQSRGLLCQEIGTVGGDSLNITVGGQSLSLPVSELDKTYEAALPRVMGD